jgi:hypothetical protein
VSVVLQAVHGYTRIEKVHNNLQRTDFSLGVKGKYAELPASTKIDRCLKRIIRNSVVCPDSYGEKNKGKMGRMPCSSWKGEQS